MSSLARQFSFWILLASLLLTVLALFLPDIAYRQLFYRHIHVFDITQSMNVDDVEFEGKTVRRLELAKQTSRRLMESMPCGSELGYAIFTEHRSFLILAPVDVCKNYTELSKILNSIDWQIAWRSRSEVAKGLNYANKINRSLDKPARVIFFTDGHESPPIHPDLRFIPEKVQADLQGIIIGIGGENPRPIPRYDADGNKRGYWRADDVSQVDVYSRGRSVTGSESLMGAATTLSTGQEHLSYLHEDYLQRMADESGMAYLTLETVNQTEKFMTQSQWGEKRIAKGDLRWLLASVALTLFILLLARSFFSNRSKNQTLQNHTGSQQSG